MARSLTELERSLRALRLSGMGATLQARALAVASHEMDFIEAFSWLVQDELDRRRSRLLERRYTLSGLDAHKGLKDFDWGYNPATPKRAILELATLKFVDAREDAGALGVDLEVDLVGLELHQRAAGGDRVACLLQPPRDARLDDGLTKLGDEDVHVDGWWLTVGG
mgnify:CR=1 FL=1